MKVVLNKKNMQTLQSNKLLFVKAEGSHQFAIPKYKSQSL